MGTILEDIPPSAEWIIKAFASENYRLDYTLDSFIEIDRFFNYHYPNGQPRKRGHFAKPGFGHILFSLGAYIGETIIKQVENAHWQPNENNPEDELNIAVRLPNDMLCFPMLRVLKRMENGMEDSIYPYGHHIINEFTEIPFNGKYWQVHKEQEETKPWWKFW